MLAPDGRPTFARRVGTADVLDNHRLLPSVFLLCLLLAGLVSVLFVISAINYSVLAWMGRGEAAERTIRRAAERRLKDSIADLDFAETRRSEEHTSELQSLMRISYAVFCLTKNNENKLRI